MEKLSTRKTLTILLSGRAGVGKTLASQLLVEYLTGRYEKVKVGVFPFAMKLKSTARACGWDGEKDEKGRRLLQRLGQVLREYDKDTWVRATFDGAIENNLKYPLDVVIIDDWRFPNEYDFILTRPLYQPIKVKILSPDREILKGTPAYSEESETSLPILSDYYDYVINNVWDLNVYKSQIENLWNSILETNKEIIRQ